MTQEATYPATEIFKAINALRPNFNIEGVDHLYVDFDPVRSESSFQALMLKLGIIDDKLDETAGYAKIPGRSTPQHEKNRGVFAGSGAGGQ